MDRRDTDAEAGREAGVGVAAAQVGQDEQGLPAGRSGDATGSRSDDGDLRGTGEVLQGAAGQIDTGRVDKHAKAPDGLVILVVNPSTRSFFMPTAGVARPITRQGGNASRPVIRQPALHAADTHLLLPARSLTKASRRRSYASFGRRAASHGRESAVRGG